MEEEIWKDIKNFEGLYQASNLGRIKSLTHIADGNHKSKTRKINGKILSTTHNPSVILYKNGKRYAKYVNHLIAEVFIPNPNNYPCVRHIDKNQYNNNIYNLEWGTYPDNLRKKCYLKGKFGKEHNRSKKINQYDKNGNFIKTWDCISDVTKQLKISSANIVKCCQHKKNRNSAGGYIWEYVDLLQN